MQQTETYKLNLIETTDPFSPAALNENTQKMEEVLTAYQANETAARKEDITALERRVTVLEAKKIVVGSYTGTSTHANETQTIRLGFTPIAVLVQFYEFSVNRYIMMHLLTPENPPLGGVMGDELMMWIVDGGFVARSDSSNEWNDEGRTYHFIAFG